jgi:adenylylsulfate kinase
MAVIYISNEMDGAMMVPVAIVTGPIGVGKTSVTHAIADLLREKSLPYALVDLDTIVECYPAPDDDPFNFRLAMANLACLWSNFRAAGARLLVISWVVESRRELAAYRGAIPAAAITVVRLRAPIDVLLERIDRRANSPDLTWEHERTRVLAEQMDRDRVEDVVVETEGRTVREIATAIVENLGWCN